MIIECSDGSKKYPIEVCWRYGVYDGNHATFDVIGIGGFFMMKDKLIELRNLINGILHGIHVKAIPTRSYPNFRNIHRRVTVSFYPTGRYPKYTNKESLVLYMKESVSRFLVIDNKDLPTLRGYINTIIHI